MDAHDVKQADTSSATPTALWWPCGWLGVDAPEVVSSLALFDPSPLVVMNPEQVDEVVRPMMRRIM
ncbi:MAG: hypothetical protein M3325_06245, partial [Actinomycetota bacterium]|nr:hypothetical protein [Actinomycetota bacterium]